MIFPLFFGNAVKQVRVDFPKRGRSVNYIERLERK